MGFILCELCVICSSIFGPKVSDEETSADNTPSGINTSLFVRFLSKVKLSGKVPK